MRQVYQDRENLREEIFREILEHGEEKSSSQDGCNDNDNDTLREVPHPSKEGLALQARVSGPWSHKKESVLLVELARWQGVQTQTVNGQSAMQQVLR